MSVRQTATIRRWQNGFGFANYYDKQNEGTLTRYFVHHRNAVTPEIAAKLGPGVRITFEHGAPRFEGEAPVALRIELYVEVVR